ncbi:MAG: hypothetical protein KAU14_01900, partial [Thermoplasmata archaeon]|nr:hypothetical protein [Thermoplasmata archaeon]
VPHLSSACRIQAAKDDTKLLCWKIPINLECTHEDTEEEGNEPDEQTPPESPPSEPHEETGKIEHFFEGTVDGGTGPSGGCHNHHFMINSSVTRIVAVFGWEDTNWDLDVSIGKGDCPVSGEVVEEDDGGRAFDHWRKFY